jgi:hypothetical protein
MGRSAKGSSPRTRFNFRRTKNLVSEAEGDVYSSQDETLHQSRISSLEESLLIDPAVAPRVEASDCELAESGV